jgi:hypothetical protein
LLNFSPPNIASAMTSFAAAEEAAYAADLTGCRLRFQQFQTAMERHFPRRKTGAVSSL